ncbi:MAG: 3-deoxy-D-manno-octulosonic acid transferase, partial [bacterium]|nr:3-deoxy-D-manno-octulosonic acid transferase [bacterium]
PLPIDEKSREDMLKQIGKRPFWLASSTHEDEEVRLAKLHKRLKEKFPDLLLIIAPRHPNRGEQIVEDIQKLGLSAALRSKQEKITPKTDVYVANTIGEMGLWYDLAKIVFIGGSLIPHGGQNFIEPSRVRDAVIVGPHMHNFTDAMNRAKKADAVMQVNDTAEMEELLTELLQNEAFLDAKRSLAYNWATSETKVLDGIMDKIKAYF